MTERASEMAGDVASERASKRASDMASDVASHTQSERALSPVANRGSLPPAPAGTAAGRPAATPAGTPTATPTATPVGTAAGTPAGTPAGTADTTAVVPEHRLSDALGATLGDDVWAVLGGGGVKGLAHVGAWQALDEAGVQIRGIVGTSIGALVGACIAGGMRWAELVPLAFALKKEDIVRVNRRAVWVNGIRADSLFHGEALREYIERVIPVKQWDELALPLQVNAVNLATGETEWFGTGARTDAPLVDALYASAALPVFYPPARIGDAWYIDGGAGDALALPRAEALGASGIIGVDVGSGVTENAEKTVEQGMMAIHQRVFSIMSGRRRREMVAGWSGRPLLSVRPRLEGYSTFDFDEIQYFLEEGYRATRAALDAGVTVPG